MKVIKKYFKVVMCFMAFALCSFLMVFAPTMTAMTAMATASNITDYSKTINSVQMPKEVDARDGGLVIPFLSNNFATGYSVKVVDPVGAIHTCKIDNQNKFVKESTSGGTVTHDAGGYFVIPESEAKGISVAALKSGNYQVIYIVEKDGIEFYSNIYNVYVNNVEYEIDFTNEDGSINLVKSKVAPSDNVKDRIEIPVPSAKIVGGESGVKTKLDPESEIVVTHNGTTLTAAETGSDFVKVNVGTDQDPEYKYYIQPSKPGLYKIEYTYKRGVNRPRYPLEIRVVKDFVEPKEFAVSTVPTFDKFELGQKGITLPKLTAKNEYEENVAYNLTSLVIEKESDSTIKYNLCGDKLNNYTFDMTLETFGLNPATDSYDKLKGNYIITYTLQGAYASAENKNEATYVKRIENVTISSSPTIKLAYDYSATGKIETEDFVVIGEEPKDASTQLQSKYGCNQIILPAAYAEDAVSSSDELIVIRRFKKVGTYNEYYYVDNIKYDSKTGEIVPVEKDDDGYNFTAFVDESKYAGDAEGLAKAQAEAAKVGKINQAVQFKFTDDNSKVANFANTYQLEYQVIAKNITKRTKDLTNGTAGKFTFTVLSTPIEQYQDTTPTVEITNISNGDKLNKKDSLPVEFTAVDTDDSRLKNMVFYYYGDEIDLDDQVDNNVELKNKITNWLGTGSNSAWNEVHPLEKDSLIEFLRGEGYSAIQRADLNENETGFVVEFNKLTEDPAIDSIINNAKKAVVVAVSYNDYGNVMVDTRTVEFKETTEKTEPTATIINTGDFNADCSDLESGIEAKIGKTIKLPTIVYSDENDEGKTGDTSLQLNLYYYIGSPVTDAGINYMSPSKKVLFNNQIKGGEIAIEKGGQYVVVYSATDDSGNTTISYFTFNVETDKKPTLSVTPKGEDIEIAGNTITAEAGTTIDFSTIVRDENGAVVKGILDLEIDDNGLDYIANGDKDMSFTFNGVGEYVFTFKASYNGKNAENKVVYINITKAAFKWLDEFNIPKYANINKDIYLPYVAASNNAKVTVTVTPPKGSKLEEDVTTVFEDNEGNAGAFWHFKTNGTTGDYIVKFVAENDGEILEESFTIKVGDNVPPTIDFLHKAELQQNIVYDGTNQIQIKFNVKKSGSPNDRYFKITATSNGETIYSYDLGMRITDIKDGSSNESDLSWTDLKYEIVGDSSSLKKESEDVYLISGTGTFTIKLSIEDDNKNPTVESIVFKVVNKAEAEEKDDTVVGVVLIVISLIVLAGVILYFMLTGKKGGNKKTKNIKSKKVKAEKLEDKKEEVVVEETKAEEVETESNEETIAEEESTEDNTEAKEGEIEE